MPYTCPEWFDEEIDANISLLNRGGWMPHEVALIQRAIRERAEFIRAGIGHPTAKYWSKRIQDELDRFTRLRWDFQSGWVLDRFSDGCYHVVGVFGFHYIREWLIDYLRERDMQRWPSPEAYLEHKRAQARKVEYENWAKGNMQLMANIDRMSNKQIQNFLNVERAIQTGETIRAHGSDEVFLDRQAAAARFAPELPRGALNPGMHPRMFRRNYGRRSPYSELVGRV
jgi:hypothetical protein